MHRHLTWLGAVLALGAGVPLHLTAQDSAPPVQAVLAGNYRFAYIAMGKGRPVVHLHARWHALGEPRSFLMELAGSSRVVSYSRRYFPPNPARPDDVPADPTTDAADLVALVRALRLDAVVLVAEGAGSTAALRAALREPGLIAGVVLIEPMVDGPLAVTADPDTNVGRRDVRVAPMDRPRPADLDAPGRPLRCEEVTGVTPPLLLIDGTTSEPEIGAAVGRMAACRPGTEVVRVDGAVLTTHDPTGTAGAVARFIATLPHPAPAR